MLCPHHLFEKDICFTYESAHQLLMSLTPITYVTEEQ